jgi:hypothetical protein
MNIKWREILIYSFFAYLFSWTYWLTALLGKNPAHPFNWLPGYGGDASSDKFHLVLRSSYRNLFPTFRSHCFRPR